MTTINLVAVAWTTTNTVIALRLTLDRKVHTTDKPGMLIALITIWTLGLLLITGIGNLTGATNP